MIGRRRTGRGTTDYDMSPELMELVAERFRVLGEPARLSILQQLRSGEKTVTELMELTGLTQANTSKHLRLLHTFGYVQRRKEGLYVVYRLADDSVAQLCNLMCGRIEQQLEAGRDMLG